MSEMTPARAKELRKEFPPSAIGKLPKPYKADSPKGQCRECGGWHGLPAVHLDYVGHAATTDRLLAVDPSWTWRPFTQDELMCLPPKLREAGLWIHLTVCGVTRPGVGDGKSAKECIGDAIRNAAMRFGVALDLWAKEDLHEISAAQQGEPSAYDDASPAQASPPPTESGDRPSKPMTAKQRSLMFALFAQKGVAEDQQLSGINAICGTTYTSRGDLTEQDARLVIDRLQAMPDVETPLDESGAA